MASWVPDLTAMLRPLVSPDRSCALGFLQFVPEEQGARRHGVAGHWVTNIAVPFCAIAHARLMFFFWLRMGSSLFGVVLLGLGSITAIHCSGAPAVRIS